MLKCQYIHYIDVKSNELFYASYANFLSSPPPPLDAQRKQRQKVGKKKGRERGIWDLCIVLSGVHTPPPHHLFPILRVLPHLPAAMVIRTGGTVRSPPCPTPHFLLSEAIAVDLQDSH
jgi:hypothetical protein